MYVLQVSNLSYIYQDGKICIDLKQQLGFQSPITQTQIVQADDYVICVSVVQRSGFLVVAFPRSSVGFRRQFLAAYHSKNLFECLRMENFVGVATLDQLVNELDPSLQIELVKDKTVNYRRDQYIQTTF